MKIQEKLLFEQLEIKANAIRGLYIKAKIYQNIAKDCESRQIRYINSSGQEITMAPENFIMAVNTAVESMPKDLQIMIQKELLDRKDYRDYWYLDTLSRSTYYRHRKEAYRQFVAFFE